MICIPTIGGDDMYIRKESYERVANKKQIIENSKISEMTADSINGVIEKQYVLKVEMKLIVEC